MRKLVPETEDRGMWRAKIPVRRWDGWCCHTYTSPAQADKHSSQEKHKPVGEGKGALYSVQYVQYLGGRRLLQETPSLKALSRLLKSCQS
jgi:hypothetical protein